jgi:hypothetical protein
MPPVGKRIRRTAKEKLLSSDLWAARIERLVALEFRGNSEVRVVKSFL